MIGLAAFLTVGLGVNIGVSVWTGTWINTVAAVGVIAFVLIRRDLFLDEREPRT